MRQRWHRRAKSVNGFMWGRVGVESRPRARKRHGTSNEETFISKGPSEGSLSRELDKRELFRVAPIAQTPSEGASKATNRGKLARSAVPNTFLCARDEVTGKKICGSSQAMGAMRSRCVARSRRHVSCSRISGTASEWQKSAMPCYISVRGWRSPGNFRTSVGQGSTPPAKL